MRKSDKHLTKRVMNVADDIDNDAKWAPGIWELPGKAVSAQAGCSSASAAPRTRGMIPL